MRHVGRNLSCGVTKCNVVQVIDVSQRVSVRVKETSMWHHSVAVLSLLLCRIPLLKKGMFLYSCVQSFGLLKELYTSDLSFHCQLDFSGKHSAMLQVLHEDYLFTYPPVSITRYSFIQLSELR